MVKLFDPSVREEAFRMLRIDQGRGKKRKRTLADAVWQVGGDEAKKALAALVVSKKIGSWTTFRSVHRTVRRLASVRRRDR